MMEKKDGKDRHVSCGGEASIDGGAAVFRGLPKGTFPSHTDISDVSL